MVANLAQLTSHMTLIRLTCMLITSEHEVGAVKYR